MEIYTNWRLFVCWTGAKQLTWLVRAGVHALKRLACCFYEGVRNRTSSILLPSVSSAALESQGRQLRPHSDDWLFSSLQCVCLCVFVCSCVCMPSPGMIRTVLIGKSLRHRVQKTVWTNTQSGETQKKRKAGKGMHVSGRHSLQTHLSQRRQ